MDPMTNLETLNELLSPREVLHRLRVGSKSALLAELAKRAGKDSGLAPAMVQSALMAREALGSTGFGHGIAVPHARLDGLTRVFCLIAVLDKPVMFDAVDGKPVDIAVLLLSPNESSSAHLAILASVTRKLRNAEVAQAIRSAASSEDVVQALV
jgi:PTS system nitrogen regulatory IIA component